MVDNIGNPTGRPEDVNLEYFAGLARQAEVEKERREEAKKHEDKMVPTEWQAELQDKRLVGSITQYDSQM